MTDNILTRAREVIDTEIAGVLAVRDGLGKEFIELVELCEKILAQNGKLVLAGIGKSGHIGCKLAATLASTGAPSVFLHPVEAMHGDLGVLGEKDLLITLSYSGETDELLAVLPAAKRIGVPIVSITGSVDSRLGQWSDLVVPMPVPKEACPFNLAPTTTTTALLALGDALALVLLDRCGFRKEDYAKLHPAGAIGRSITLRITDIMRTGDRFATVSTDTTVKDALSAMTGSRCGSVTVVDSEGVMLGIFTDGDFRRHVTEDFSMLNEPVKDLMTENPVTINADSMAIELVNLLEKRQVDDIIVVDNDGKAVGLVDIQDLPKFKVM